MRETAVKRISFFLEILMLYDVYCTVYALNGLKMQHKTGPCDTVKIPLHSNLSLIAPKAPPYSNM